jgi:hypothetical protein
MGLTQALWDSMTPAQKDEARDLGGLSYQLIGLEGCRVEVETTYNETRRFLVGRSTGWRPCHLELHNRNSHGGQPADHVYKSVRVIRRMGS